MITPSNTITSPALRLAPLMAVAPLAGLTGPDGAVTVVLLNPNVLVVAAGRAGDVTAKNSQASSPTKCRWHPHRRQRAGITSIPFRLADIMLGVILIF
jgi:hypothetical protein